MIETPAEYFAKGCGRCDRFATPACSTRTWLSGLNHLRQTLLSEGLRETAKWGHPCYMHQDHNIAMLGAFKSDFRLTFFNAALLKDPEGILERPGPNSQVASMIRFTDANQVASFEPAIRAYVKESIGYAEAGVKPQKQKLEIELPVELLEALDGDPELAEAFHNLTPGRQRSYVINLSSAKTSATRNARIAKFRDKIIAGRGALER